MMRITALFVLLFAFCPYTNGQDDGSNGKARTPQNMLRRMLKDYDRSEPPRTDRGTEVKVGMYINSMFGMDSQKMDYSMSFYLRMSWQDPRLAFEADRYSSIRAYQGAWDDIWTPDLFIRNEKDAKAISIISPQRLLKINATGHAWYVVKYAATLSCPMKLQKFPFDNQLCPIMFESFGYTMDTMYLRWLSSPVDVDPGIQLPQFTLWNTILSDCSQNYTAGAFPCLEVQFLLHRDMGYYILVVFIPSSLLVIISWLQFWLSADAVTGRVLVGLFTTFTIVGQMSSLRSTLPEVSYLTTLDIWMMICCLFISATLIELVAVQFVTRRSKQENGGEQEKDDGGSDGSRPERIDFISRIAFPVAFLVFNILFVMAMFSTV